MFHQKAICDAREWLFLGFILGGAFFLIFLLHYNFLFD
ncbi:MAG: hypothetical protein RL757_2555 [Bacteroidota bacterium]|jgi:hypothetical protein